MKSCVFQYMDLFKSISSSTASRDLRKGVEMKLFTKLKSKCVVPVRSSTPKGRLKETALRGVYGTDRTDVDTKEENYSEKDIK